MCTWKMDSGQANIMLKTDRKCVEYSYLRGCKLIYFQIQLKINTLKGMRLKNSFHILA